MKPEIRRDLARLPFEEKIRKVAELIRLSRKVKDQRTAVESNDNPVFGGSLRAAAGNPQSGKPRRRKRG